MREIYGYKEKDVLGLAQFITHGEYKNLSDAFTKYAKISSKARGTVRNLYYALARKSREDGEFCKKYLNGKVLNVNSIVAFTSKEEKELVDNVVKLTANGRSVRSAIIELSGGDNKLSLRYQNKFRNVVKRNPQLKNRNLLEGDGKTACTNQIEGLKEQFSRLVDKAFLKVKKENQTLLSRVIVLEKQNKNLKEQLNSFNQGQRIARFFVNKDSGELLS